MSTKLVDLFNQFAGSTPSGVDGDKKEAKPVTDYLKKVVDTFVVNIDKKLEGKMTTEHHKVDESKLNLTLENAQKVDSANMNQYFDISGENEQNGTTLEQHKIYDTENVPIINSNGSIIGGGEVIHSSATPVILNSPGEIDNSYEAPEQTDFEKWFENDGAILLQQYNSGRIDMRQYCDAIVEHIPDEALHEMHVDCAKLYNAFGCIADTVDEKYAGTDDARQLMLMERRQNVREYLDTMCASLEDAEKVRVDTVEMSEIEASELVGTDAFVESMLYGVGVTQQEYRDYKINQQMSSFHSAVGHGVVQLQESNGLSPMETPDAP